MTTKAIEQLAEDALNAACLVIQEELDITDGGYAGAFFSDNEVRDKFIAYIEGELRGIEFDRL